MKGASKSRPANRDQRIASHCICCNGDTLEKSPAVLMPFIAKRAFDWEPVEITADWGLRDLVPGMAYPLCNSVQCTNCGALFLDIRFTDSEMASLYSGYRGDEYTNLRDRFEPGYRARNAIIAGGSTHIPAVEAFLSTFVTPPLAILDWGGDTGSNTPFKSQSRVLHIYDISNRPTIDGAVRVGRDAMRRAAYDLIVLSHVLEHIPYPAKVVAETRALMDDDTVLYIEVPHEELLRQHAASKGAHRLKRHWHEHINFFTPESLEALLECCGLRSIGMQSIESSGDVKKWHVLGIACKLKVGGPGAGMRAEN